MLSKIYHKGRRKEYSICDKLKNEGFDIVQRSKGSHSPIDIFAINRKLKVIKFIQSKRILNASMNETEPKQKERIEKEFSWLTDVFRVEFEVL